MEFVYLSLVVVHVVVLGVEGKAGLAIVALDAAADQPGGRGRGGSSARCPSCPREISTQRGKFFGVGGAASTILLTC